MSEDQTDFIRGRQLSSNIRRLLNIISAWSNAVKPEIVLSLDAEQAFDRVEWGYLFKVLEKFGFGKKFITWIRLLYSSPLAGVNTNRQYSTYFPLSRGTRQGCLLSPLLFALAIEPAIPEKNSSSARYQTGKYWASCLSVCRWSTNLYNRSHHMYW